MSEITAYVIDLEQALELKISDEAETVIVKLSEHDDVVRLKNLEIKMLREQRDAELNTNLLLTEWKFSNERERLKQFEKEKIQLDDEIRESLKAKGE